MENNSKKSKISNPDRRSFQVLNCPSDIKPKGVNQVKCSFDVMKQEETFTEIHVVSDLSLYFTKIFLFKYF